MTYLLLRPSQIIISLTESFATLSDKTLYGHDASANSDNATSWHYHPETFIPLAKETTAPDRGETELFYIVTDHLGTPREMFSESGKLVWAVLYRTWGGVKHIFKPDNDNDRLVLDTPPGTGRLGNLAIRYDTIEEQQAQDCPIRFQGQWEDAETGLYYNRYRYYDPLVGQYMSPDPLGLEGGTRPQGYVDNPSASIDPWGLEHLNFNGATGNFGVYEIYMDGEVYKIGKADLNRITQSSDLPTRLHQQIVKLRKLYPNKKVTGDVVERGFKTTAEAKAAETARLDRYYKKTNGGIPKGNTKSYKPYSKKGR